MSRAGLAKTAVLITVLALTSRILGFGRWLVFSQTVGDTCLGDVYNAANQLPNVLFEIVAGGVLAGVVVPIVARHVGAGRRQQADQTSSALISWTLLVLTPVVALAVIGARAYASVFTAPTCPGGVEVGAALVIIFAPQIWLYGLAVVSAGILAAHHRFVAAAAGPLLSSVVVMASYAIFAGLLQNGAGPGQRMSLHDLDPVAVGVLGWGTTAGVAVLACATLIPLAAAKLRLRPRLRFADGDASLIGGFVGAGIAGLIVQQLTMLLVIWVARQTHDPGAVTRATWANTIYLLPYAVLAVPLLQLIFPRLSAAAEHGDEAIRAVAAKFGPTLVLLAGGGAALLVATAVPIARVFVSGPGSGRTEALAWPIVAFAPAVIGFSLLGLATRTLLAGHRTTASGLTTVIAWCGAAVAILAAHLLLPTAGVVTGIGAAISIGMVLGAITGGWLVRARIGPIGLRAPLLVAVPSALLAGGVVWLFSRALTDSTILVAVIGGIGAALACVLLYVGSVLLIDLLVLNGRLRRTLLAVRGGAA